VAKPGAENRSLPTILIWLNVCLKIFSGFGLRSVSGASCAEGGEKRIAKRSRSATSRRRATDGSTPQLRLSQARS